MQSTKMFGPILQVDHEPLSSTSISTPVSNILPFMSPHLYGVNAHAQTTLGPDQRVLTDMSIICAGLAALSLDSAHATGRSPEIASEENPAIKAQTMELNPQLAVAKDSCRDEQQDVHTIRAILKRPSAESSPTIPDATSDSMTEQATYVERYLDHVPSYAGRYPEFGVKRLRHGPSGSHGRTFLVRLLSKDGLTKGPLAFLKTVPRTNMKKRLCEDIRTYARLSETAAGLDSVADKELSKFRVFLVDLKAFHEDPYADHVEFFFVSFHATLNHVNRTHCCLFSSGSLWI